MLRRNLVLMCGMIGLVGLPGVARAEWITLTAGAAGNAQATVEGEYWYGPHAPPFVAVNQLTGTGTVTATTDGGWTYFAGLGTPVVLDLSNGSASITGGSPPSGAAMHGPGGSSAGSLASAAPQAGGPIPLNAALLGISITPGTNGTKVLTVAVTDSNGSGLGSDTLNIPDGGWWVIGIGPGQEPTPPPLPEPEPTPEPPPVPPPSSTPGVPEPATFALVSSATVLVLPWLRRRGGVRGMNP